MPNRWTGNFDVVIQAGLAAVNGFLAVHHREERYPHGMRFNLPLPARDSDTSDSGDGGGGLDTLHPGGLVGWHLPSHFRTRGLLELQIGSPMLVLPDEPGDSRVTIEYPAMAHFAARPDSRPAPEFAHFRLYATVDVDQVIGPGDSLLEIALSSDDVELECRPAPFETMTPEDANRIAQIARMILYDGFGPVNLIVETGGDSDFAIRHWRFKMLYGEESAAAVLVNLGDRVPTEADRAGVTETFIRSRNDVSVALGRDFIVATLQRLAEGWMDELRLSVSIPSIPIPVPGPITGTTLCSVTFGLEPETAAIELREGSFRVEIAGQVSPTVTASAPDWDIAMDHCRNWFHGFGWTVRQDFELRTWMDTIVLRAQGDPTIEVDADDIRAVLEAAEALDFFGEIRSYVSEALSSVEAGGTAAIQEMLYGLESLVRDGLQMPGVTLHWASVSIDPDGVLLHSTPRFSGGFGDPVVSFTSRLLPGDISNRILELDGFASWIPGGRIQRYRWQGMGADGEVVEEIADNQFLARIEVPVGTAGWPPSHWCLEVTGYQPDMRGTMREVSGSVCGFAAVQPPIVGIFGHTGIAVATAGGDVMGYFDPWEGGAQKRFDSGCYLLLHFGGPQPGTSLRRVSDCLAKRQQDGLIVLPLVILGKPPNRKQRKSYPGFAWTDDPVRVWRRHFKPKGGEATLLVGPTGDLLWRHNGPADRKSLEAALDKHLRPTGRRPQWRPQRPRIRHGVTAPDFLFDYMDDRKVPLRRFRGRQVILNFWTTWAKGCLEELRRLDALARKTGGRKRLILAINDGESPRKAAAFLKKNKISLKLVTDPERQIASRYKVSTWPTTLVLDPQGRIAKLNLGRRPQPPVGQKAVGKSGQQTGKRTATKTRN